MTTITDTSSQVELRREILRLAGELDVARAEITRLEASSHEDPLTGLLNRRGFERDVAHAIQFVRRYKSTLGLLMIDLDRFKPINDTYGHAVGDQALQHVSRLLGKYVRASDSAARLGGDEFAVIMWQVDPVKLRHKAGTLEDVLQRNPMRVGNESVSVSASIGGVIVDPAQSTDIAMRQADEALYARKRDRQTLGLR